jgi:VWFA-related protein
VVRSFVNEVIVPAVVRDAQGHAVGNLTKDDFEVFDDGKPQAITGFMLIRRAETGSPSPNPGVPATHTTGEGATSTQRFVVFLFDDLNLSIDDLPRVQQAAVRALDSSLAASDTAAVLATSGSNSGLTRDRSKLKQAIMNLKTTPIYRHDEHECPSISYYQGDKIINQNDGIALQAAMADFVACSQNPAAAQAAEGIVRGAAQRAVALGEQNYRSNLEFLRLVLSKMGQLPGQHVIILVSPGFLTPDAEAMNLKSEVLDIAARANVVINALDARGLYTTNRDASQPGGLDPSTTSIEDQYRQFSMLFDENVMAELADGTGGTFFHNNNNLEAGFSGLVAVPEYLYLLAYSTANMKPNGAYHGLKVKVNQPGLTIQARRGYFAPKPQKTK